MKHLFIALVFIQLIPAALYSQNSLSDVEVCGKIKTKTLFANDSIISNIQSVNRINIYSNDSFDKIEMYAQQSKPNTTDFKINICDDNQGDDRFLIGNTYCGDGLWHTFMSVVNNGRVGIKTENPQSELDVNGKIRAKEVVITETGWADFVFEKDYQLPTLPSVKEHIKTYKTLPGIPSEKKVKKEGVNLADINAKLLQKIEELTLYIIAQDERIVEIEKKLENKQ